MNKITRIVISFLLSLTVLFPLQMIRTVNAGTEIAGGVCGPDAFWSMHDDGKLVITGSGSMNDYTYTGSKITAPWYIYCYEIKEIDVSGIDCIGAYAFADCRNVWHVSLRDIDTIHESAFWRCKSLKQVDLSDRLTYIGPGAFNECGALRGVTYLGCVHDWDETVYIDIDNPDFSLLEQRFGQNSWDYIWNMDHSQCTFRFFCNKHTKYEVSLENDYLSTNGEEPTCTEDGYIDYQAFLVFRRVEYASPSVRVPLYSPGHDYKDPVYTWSKDNSQVKAEMVCRNDSSHVVSETVKTTYKETQAPSCEKEGKGTYTAVFSQPAFKKQTKNVTVKALGHDWKAPVYTWSGDNSIVTAKAVCKRDAGHIMTESAASEYTVLEEPGYHKEGKGRYTAVFKTDIFKKQTKTVTIPGYEASPVDMHRIYNPNSGEHFYTKDEKEKDALVNVHHWVYEGVGWVAPDISAVPVYRLYNKTGGEHHYTVDKAERDALINKYGWKDEGIGWYSDEGKTVPVFREYNPNAFANNHNYTPDLNEHNALINIYNWKDEGTAWYGIGGKK